MSDIRSKVSLLRHALTLARGRVPSQLIIQLTDSCNATCPQCGMRRNAPFRRSLLPLDQGRRIIDHAANSGVSALSFTGGEPFLYSKNLLTLLHYAGAAGIPYIRTGTNGFLFKNPESDDFSARISRLAEALAATKLYTFWISVDSPDPELHESMRGLPDVMKGIERALPIFHDHGIFPSANLGITKAILPKRTAAQTGSEATCEEFRAGFRAFYRRILDMGFTIANACYPMHVEQIPPHLSARSTRQRRTMLVSASATGKNMRCSRPLQKPSRNSVPVSEYFLPSVPCTHWDSGIPARKTGASHAMEGVTFSFIDAKAGDTYPCGYRGTENLGKFWDLDLKTPPCVPSCRECDWECFRDPSEFLGPFQEFCSAPLSVARHLLRDRRLTSLWLKDLRYHRAAGYFNGRQASDYRRLSRFKPSTMPPSA